MSTVAKKIMMGSGAVAEPFEIEQSLLFSQTDDYLKRTPSSAGNRRTFTLSYWIKITTIDGTSRVIMTAGTSNSDVFHHNFESGGTPDDALRVVYYTGSAFQINLTTNRVFRDPSAWYHIVLAIDTTQGTAANRVKMYVNGVQETSFATSVYPNQNIELNVNTATAHWLGRYHSADFPLKSYLAETHFIDGAAKAPSDFGETNEDTGQWIPKEYTGGSYGTNGFYLPFKDNASFSVVFDGSGDGLSSPASNDFDLGTGDWTVEFFIKAPDQSDKFIVSFRSDSNDLHITTGGYQSTSGVLRVSFGGSSYVSSTVVCNNTWKHCAITRSSNTVRMYVNGSLETTATNSTNMSAGAMAFATNGIGGGNNFTGNLSNFRMLKGTALYTGSSFTVPASSLTAITNTVVLALQSNTLIDNSPSEHVLTAAGNTSVSNDFPSQFTSSTGIGTDSSGQGNNLTPVNLLNSDVVIDTPTNNFCTLNSVMTYSATTLSEGNLKSAQSNHSDTMATFKIPETGKWYFECVATTAGGAQLGISKVTYQPSAGSWVSTTISLIFANGQAGTGSGSAYIGSAISNGNTVGVAIDSDNGKIYFAKNNTWGNSGNPLTGSNPAAAFTATDGWQPIVYGPNGAVQTFNFGQKTLAYTPPSGFLTLSTKNLPEPAIPLSSANFNTVLWAGNATARTIDVGMQPSFTWIKVRNNAGYHYLADAVRGFNTATNGSAKALTSNDTDAELASETQQLMSFASNGFTLGTNSDTSFYVNRNNDTYVAWNWKANGAGSTDTSGDIDAVVSANQAAGFSIITWTGDGGGHTTVPHGLGVAPEIIFEKYRNATGNWYTWLTVIDGTNDFLRLDLTAAAGDAGASGTPTSQFFSNWGSPSGRTNVAYAFVSKPGFSKIATYIGNGNTDGPFVNCGFKPAFVMRKKTSDVADWWINDIARTPSNVSKTVLRANLNAAEVTSGDDSYSIDILSNGFKVRGVAGYLNQNTGVYLYMAFAKSPFKTANAH